MRNREDLDSMDELFQSKLYDFEVETMPGDWEKIEARLPKKNIVPFYRKAAYYWAAAVVAALLLITGTIHMFKPQSGGQQIAESLSPMLPTEDLHPVKGVEENMAEPVKMEIKSREKTVSPGNVPVSVLAYVDVEESDIDIQAIDLVSNTFDDDSKMETEVGQAQDIAHFQPSVREQFKAKAENVRTAVKHTPAKHWRFGMGGGSVSTGTSSSMNTYAFRNTSFSDVELLSSNALNTKNEEAAKTDVDHNVPVSFGIGVSYVLNNRFALESGLNYSYLRSKWKTNGLYHKTTVQKLHFIGIPLSLSYKIAEWQKIRFYTAVGAMAEVNIAGKVSTNSYVDDSRLCDESNNIRMKEWYWSVNARLGASYPIWRYMSLYAEVGASYYFDNDSEIETIHTSKPFNVDLQAGFRFNF